MRSGIGGGGGGSTQAVLTGAGNNYGCGDGGFEGYDSAGGLNRRLLLVDRPTVFRSRAGSI